LLSLDYEAQLPLQTIPVVAADAAAAGNDNPIQ
jgi:hypothetical protein